MSKSLDLDGAGFLLLGLHTNTTSTCLMNSNQDRCLSSNYHRWAFAQRAGGISRYCYPTLNIALSPAFTIGKMQMIVRDFCSELYPRGNLR